MAMTYEERLAYIEANTTKDTKTYYCLIPMAVSYPNPFVDAMSKYLCGGFESVEEASEFALEIAEKEGYLDSDYLTEIGIFDCDGDVDSPPVAIVKRK